MQESIADERILRITKYSVFAEEATGEMPHFEIAGGKRISRHLSNFPAGIDLRTISE